MLEKISVMLSKIIPNLKTFFFYQLCFVFISRLRQIATWAICSLSLVFRRGWTSMGNLCWFKNGQFSHWSAKWLHKISLFVCPWTSESDKTTAEEKVANGREHSCRGENAIRECLVGRDKTIFPPLHINLYIMKQFMKALDQDEPFFEYMKRNMSWIIIGKLRVGIFNDPGIRLVLEDFIPEWSAWTLLVLFVKNFLDNYKAENNTEPVNYMLINCREHYCISIKVHYLYSYLYGFPEYLGDMREEQGEGFRRT